jgi:hypothetical protein
MTLRQLTRNPAVSGAIIFAILTLVGLVWYSAWQVLFTILLSWVLADAIISAIFRGGRGIFQNRLLGTSAQPKGYAYLTFSAAIVITTLISNGVSQLFIDLVNSQIIVVAESFFATLFVWSDLQLRYYRD